MTEMKKQVKYICFVSIICDHTCSFGCPPVPVLHSEYNVMINKLAWHDGRAMNMTYFILSHAVACVIQRL